MGQARDLAAKEVGISGRQLDKIKEMMTMKEKEQKKDFLQIELDQAREAYKHALENTPEAKAKKRVFQAQNRIRDRAILKGEGNLKRADKELQRVNREEKAFLFGIRDAEKRLKAAHEKRQAFLERVEKVVRKHQEALKILEALRAGILKEEPKLSKNVPLGWEEKDSEIKEIKKSKSPEFEEKK